VILSTFNTSIFELESTRIAESGVKVPRGWSNKSVKYLPPIISPCTVPESSPMNSFSDVNEYAISPICSDPSTGAAAVVEYLVFIIVPDILNVSC